MSFFRRASAFDLARRGGARFIPSSNSDGGSPAEEDYMASGTYTPTVSVTGVGNASLPDGVLGWSRVGNYGGPSAGDTITVYGRVTLTGMADNDLVTFALPFVLASAPYSGSPGASQSTTMTIDVIPQSTTVLGLDVTVVGDDTGNVSFSFIYRAENAVDP